MDNEKPSLQEPAPTQQTAMPAQVLPSDPFGGAPANEPPPGNAGKSKKGGGRITCLVLALVFGTICLIALVVLVGAVSSFLEGREPSLPRLAKGSNSVALLKIDEPIFEGQKCIEVLEHYIDDDSLRAVLVQINSPGGTVGASQELYNGILRLRRSGKKVVVTMGSVAASGGYYAACAADRIFSNPGTMTGSIGVIMSLPQFNRLAEKVGVGSVVIKSGKFKDVPSIMRPLAPEERALLQGVITDTYEQFLDAVLEGRREHLDKAVQTLAANDMPVFGDLPTTLTSGEQLLRHVADGRIMTGRQAKALGLVDELGGKREALESLARLAGIPGKPELYEYKIRRSIIDMLETGASGAVKSLPIPLEGARLEYRMPF